MYFFTFGKKLEGLPQLTAEQLRRKQEQAEQKRAKVRMNYLSHTILRQYLE